MTRDKSSHHPALHAFFALCAAALVSVIACSKAQIVDDTQGGGKSGGAGNGATGAGGGGGRGTGINVNLDAAVVPHADSGSGRPGGGTCGDGTIERSEQCDDGNTLNGDGCSRICQIEANWNCPNEGKACVYVGNCGSGFLTSNKVCDDGNTTDGDGCSADCQSVDPNYICRVPGKPCTPKCGDGVIKGAETCDDGNAGSGDGCSASCKVEPGFQCTGTPSTCKPTVCGNGTKETGEGCDDGNTLPYDGCSPTCQVEPKCGTYDSKGTPTGAVGACQTGCGDGILLRGTEECDDGNLLDGDGCSKDCKIEKGWTCTSAYDNPPTSLTIPLVARDFQSYSDGNPPSGHPDFGHYCCDDSLTKGKGILGSTLGTDRKPQWAGPADEPLSNASQVLFTGHNEFNQWYRDVSGTNMTYYENLTLLQSKTNKTTYAMNSDTDSPWYDLCGFFPLDDLTKPLLDQNTGQPVTYHYDQGQPDDRLCHAYQGLGFGNSWANHNYSFTTELRYWFQYEGNENLQFTGDDDVWVFINGTMAVEMPGTHNRSVAVVALDASKGTAQVTYPNNSSLNTSVDLKLTIGSVYEVVVFQAERWCCGSNYMLTLANFLAGKSQCVPACGDGVAVADEECDCGDGSGTTPSGCPGPNNDTTYGGCTTQCKWGPFCGDATVQSPPNGPEECDLGKQNCNGTSGCSIACQAPRACGDGKVDTDLGEECDLGGNNGLKLDSNLQPVADQNGPDGAVYCTSDCKIPPGIVY